MTDIAIRVQNLCKRYRIGRKEEMHDTMAGALVDFVKRPLTNLRRLRQLSRFSQNGHEAEDVIWALKDVSFEVQRGEVVGIIGRNGAGKSTLLKILSRITEPTSGRVELRGRVSSLLEVGTGFHPELTGRENIYLNGTILGMRKAEIERKFEEIVDFSGVEKFIDTPVKRYSSGMRVRLAFAVAAHLEPEILLVDEVLAVGDVEFQKKCLGKMEDVSKGGRTILFVSHQMAAVQNLCPRTVLLNQGNVSANGNTRRVINEYLRQLAENDQTPLHEKKARSGNGAICFTSIRLKNEGGEYVNAFRSGEDAILELFYNNHAHSEIKSLHVAVGIDDSMGQRIAVLSSEVTNDVFPSVPAKNDRIEIYIKRLPLNPGRYHLTVFSTISGQIADWVTGAGSFDVLEGDFFKTGKLVPPSQGNFLIDHSFRISECSIAKLSND